MRLLRTRHVCLTLLLLSIPGFEARAAGFYLQEQSTTAMGAAYAGASAAPKDAGTIYYNAAGLTELDRGQVSVNGDAFFVQGDLEDNGSTLLGAPVAGVDSDDPTPFLITPNFYAAYPVFEGRIWIGLGLSTPFGLTTKYDDDWFGRFDSIGSELTTTDIQPSVAVEVTDWLSIGGGPNIQYVDAELSNAVTNGVTEGTATLTGTDWSAGYSLGALVKPTKETTLGINYRSAINHTLDGRIRVTGAPGLNEDVAGTGDLNLPEVLSIGLAHNLNQFWTVLIQTNYFGWDSFEDITTVRDNGTIATSIRQDFQSTWSYAIGAEYRWRPDLTLRFGYQFDETPTTDTFRNTRIPDGDRHNIGVGLTYDAHQDVAVSAGGFFGFMEEQDVNVSRNAGAAQVNVKREDATYQILSLGLTYKLP